MKRWTGLLGGLLAGAGLMYLLDPDRGARRRALVRDQALSARRRAKRVLDTTIEDARNRATGTLTEARQRLRREAVPDDVLVERVRARLGLVSERPDAIEVRAENGCVTLRGVVARSELAAVVRSAKWTRGVHMVDDQLEAHDQPKDDATATSS